MFKIFLISLVTIFSFPYFSYASFVSSTPSMDNWIVESAPNENDGTNQYLEINQNGGASARARIITKLDISSIPASSTISSAYLKLYYNTYGGTDPNGQYYETFKLNRSDWNETQSDWGHYKTGSSWSTSGGDFNTSIAGVSSTVPASFGFQTFDITNIVQNAINAGATSTDILIKANNESQNSYVLYYSIERTTASQKPYYEITYSDYVAPSSTQIMFPSYGRTYSLFFAILLLSLICFLLWT